jgi:hypothetical protein
MSLYTESDYTALKSAYLQLVAGEKTVQASVSGEFVRFQDSQLGACKKLLDAMAVSLGYVTTRSHAKPIGRFE